MVKREPKPKLKPITYKFFPSILNGSVTLKGLGFDETEEEEPIPQAILDVLNGYGFDWSHDDLDGGRAITWVDCVRPLLDLDDLECLCDIVPVRISSWLKKVRGRESVAFYDVMIGMTRVEQGRNLLEVLQKAHRSWNREGRPINTVKFKTAMDQAVETANKKRRDVG